MHHLFKVVELVDMILKNLDPDSGSKASRVCRIFYNEGTNSAWRRGDGSLFTSVGPMEFSGYVWRFTAVSLLDPFIILMVY